MGSRFDPHEVAVFTRNHRTYLDQACERNPGSAITFRARARPRPARALDRALMRVNVASRLVNSVRNNGPELLEPDAVERAAAAAA